MDIEDYHDFVLDGTLRFGTRYWYTEESLDSDIVRVYEGSQTRHHNNRQGLSRTRELTEEDAKIVIALLTDWLERRNNDSDDTDSDGENEQ